MHYVRESLASEPEMRCGAWGIYFISHPVKQDISRSPQGIILHLPSSEYFTVKQATDTTKRAGCSHGE
jgi:hypothetical protein